MNVYSEISANKLRSTFLIGGFMVLITFFFYLMGQYYGDPYTFLILGLGFSFFSSFTSYFYSDKIVLKMAGAKPADKKEYFDFYTVTENLAMAAGLPMPKLYVIQDESPNAFATGRDPKHAVVAATTGLLERLDRSDIEGVIAHELSHVKNYDILVMTIVTVLVGTVAYAADFGGRMMFHSRSSDNNSKGSALGLVVFLLLLVLMPIIATLIQFAVSRKREFLADASGVLLTRNPEGLADALEKIAADPHVLRHASNATAHMYIANPFKKGGKTIGLLTHLFSTHPPMEERVRRLRGM